MLLLLNSALDHLQMVHERRRIFSSSSQQKKLTLTGILEAMLVQISIPKLPFSIGSV